MKLLIIGCNSVLGQVVSLYCVQKEHRVSGIDERKRFDFGLEKFYQAPISKDGLNMIFSVVQYGCFDAIINCSALLIKESEENPERAEFVNSEFPHILEDITKETKTVVIHRSTDCIFSGKKGNYSLDDEPDGYSVYAKTKAKGEIKNNKDITIRTSLIGPDRSIFAPDLFGWFNNMRGDVKGFANSIWTGITTIEYAKEILFLLGKRAHGIYQCVPNTSISKYELLLLFEKYFSRNRNIIKVENEKNDKSLKQEIDNSGLLIPSYEEQIKEMKEWINEQYTKNNIYSQYLEEI